MPKKKEPQSPFGLRLYQLRKDKGLTQIELAKAIDSTQRAISYYETAPSYPPAPIVAKLAKALEVTSDELLGLEASTPKKTKDNVESRLLKKFQKITRLPEKDQRAIMRMVNSLVASHQKNAS